MIIPTISEDELIKAAQEYLDAHAPPRYRPGDITHEIAEAAWGLKRTAAQKKLKELVDAGELERINDAILPNGSVGTVWRIIKPAV